MRHYGNSDVKRGSVKRTVSLVLVLLALVGAASGGGLSGWDSKPIETLSGWFD